MGRKAKRVLPGGPGCMCEMYPTCNGLGNLECKGCGGDQCICACGNPGVDCNGCEDCDDPNFDDYDGAEEGP